MADIIRFPDLNRNCSKRPLNDDERPMQTAPQRFAGQADRAAKSARGTADECEPHPLADAPDGNAVVRAIALCYEIRRSGDVPLPDVAWIIRTAMPRLKRCGRKWSSLPELHRGLLEQHCAAGNPTALMFRGWIEGTHLNGLVHSTGDAQSLDVLLSNSDIQGGF